MNVKDKIKDSALLKLRKCVRLEVQYLKDAQLPLDNFKIDIDSLFSDEEKYEISKIVESLNTSSDYLKDFCKYNDIEL